MVFAPARRSRPTGSVRRPSASNGLDKPGAASAQCQTPAGVVINSSLVKAVGFVHLHVHSAFSLREGALSIEALAKLAKADSMPALAITDTNNLFGALEFSEKLAKAGVQPIIGAQITVDFGDAPPSASRLAEARVARAPLVLIAKDEQGYRALMRLASRVWLDPTDGDEPHVGFAAAGRSRGPDRAHRRTGRADRPGAGARPARTRASAAEAARAAVRRPALRRTAAPRPGQRAPRRAGADRTRLCAEPAAGRRQRALFRRRRRLRGARRAAVRRRRRADQRRRRAAACRRSIASRPAPKCARCSPISTEALDNSVEIALRCAYRPLTRKPILPHFTAADGDAVDEESEAAPPGRRRARAASGATTAARPAMSKTTTASGSNSSSASSRG